MKNRLAWLPRRCPLAFLRTHSAEGTGLPSWLKSVGASTSPAGAGAPAEEWFTAGRFAVILGLLIFGMFPEVVLGIGTFFHRDYGIFGYPLAHYYRESFWRGELPLWNPLNNCGLPFLAQWNTQVLYPPALFYLLLPLSWSLGVFCLGHLFLGGLGMYALARHWVGNRLAAAVAGTAYALNGFTWHCLMWPNNISALGWLPLVILAVDRAWREGGRRIAVAALAGGVQMLTGAPEVILLTWILIGLLWLAEVVPAMFGGLFHPARHLGQAPQTEQVNEAAVAPRPEGEAISPAQPPGFCRMAGRLGLVVLAVAGLAAAQLLPFMDLALHSQRDANYGGADWSMPCTGWANLLVPLFECFRSHYGVFVQFDQYWANSYYVGIGVIALALVAAWQVRQRRIRVLLLVAGVSLILALGDDGHLFTWLKKLIPQLGLMRFPIKFVLPVVFILPLLAGYGFAWCRSLPAPAQSRGRRSLLLISVILLALLAVIGWFAYRYPAPREEWALTVRNALERAVFLGVIVGMVLGFPWAERFRHRWWLGVALLFTLALDIHTHAPNLQPTAPRSIYTPGLIRAHGKFDPPLQHGVARAMESDAAVRKMYFRSLTTPVEDYLGRRLALHSNCNLLDDFPKLNGFYSLFLKEADRVNLLFHARTNANIPVEPFLDFLNVAHVTARGEITEWTRRPGFMSLATIGQQPIFADPETTFQALTNAAVDFRRVVYLPRDAQAAFRPGRPTEARIHSSRFSAHRVRLETEATDATVVVVAQNYYHPWKAYVDGAATPLWRANYAYQALAVPAGRHRIELVYEDRLFWAGAAISGLSLAGCLAGWRAGRKRSDPAPA